MFGRGARRARGARARGGRHGALPLWARSVRRPARLARRGTLGRRRRPPDGGRNPRASPSARRFPRDHSECRWLDRFRRGGALAWRVPLLRLNAGRRRNRGRGHRTMTGAGPASLIYDGACAFCRRWVERAHRCDRDGVLEMVPYQSPDLERRFPAVSREDCARRVHLVDARGVVYRGAAAAREALRRLPGGRLWSLPFGLPGGLTAAERVYDWVAYRFGPLDHEAAAGRDREVAETPTLLDALMPGFDFGNRHAIVVAAPPERVAEAAETYSLATDGSAFVRLLFRLRGLTPPSGTLRAAARAMGFAVLAEEPRREIVLGVAGRFWALDERANLISLP